MCENLLNKIVSDQIPLCSCCGFKCNDSCEYPIRDNFYTLGSVWFFFVLFHDNFFIVSNCLFISQLGLREKKLDRKGKIFFGCELSCNDLCTVSFIIKTFVLWRNHAGT